MKCPFCGAELPDEAKVCDFCGKEIGVSDTAQEPEIEEVKDAGEELVSEASEIKEEVKDAGEELVSEASEVAEEVKDTGANYVSEQAPVAAPVTEAKTSKEKKGLGKGGLAALIIVVVVALIGAAVCAWLLLSDATEKKKDDSDKTEVTEKQNNKKDKEKDSGAEDDGDAEDEEEPLFPDPEAIDVVLPEDCEGIEEELNALKEMGIAVDNFDYSAPFDEKGLYKDIKALDYVNLCDYDKIKLTKDQKKEIEDSVQETVDQMLSQYAETEQITDRAVKDGDTVNIDYVGSIDGVEFEGGNTQGAGTEVTIGVTSYIDDFLEQIVGHKPGDTFDVCVTFPEDYINETEDPEGAARMNGKDAVFKTTVNYISEQKLSEFDDEFVKTNLESQYGWATAEEARTQIYNDTLKSYISEYLVKNTEVTEIPDKLVYNQVESMLSYYSSMAEQYGMTFTELLQTGFGVESLNDLLNEYNQSFKDNAKNELIMQAVAEDAKIKVSDDEIDKILKDDFNIEDRSEVEDIYGKNYVVYVCRNQKMFDMLNKNVTFSK